jgi:chaperonin GroEL (HSP60 family)
MAGLNVSSGESEEDDEQGVVEPRQTKTQAVQSASESAEMILRIDDVIAASGFDAAGGDSGGGAPEGGPGGGGMPGGGMGGLM